MLTKIKPVEIPICFISVENQNLFFFSSNAQTNIFCFHFHLPPKNILCNSVVDPKRTSGIFIKNLSVFKLFFILQHFSFNNTEMGFLINVKMLQNFNFSI